jgi:Flp pilus assembly protein TadD
MKSRRSMTVVLVSGLIAGGTSLSARSASADQNALRVKARAELAAVTVDVDRANIMFSPAESGLGSNFTKVEQYQQDDLVGRQSFQDGRYGEALQHLRKADELIRSQPDWTESE